MWPKQHVGYHFNVNSFVIVIFRHLRLFFCFDFYSVFLDEILSLLYESCKYKSQAKQKEKKYTHAPSFYAFLFPSPPIGFLQSLPVRVSQTTRVSSSWKEQHEMRVWPVKVYMMNLGSVVIPWVTQDGINEDDGRTIGCQEYGVFKTIDCQ